MDEVIRLVALWALAFIWIMALIALWSRRSNNAMIRHANHVNRTRSGHLPIQEEES